MRVETGHFQPNLEFGGFLGPHVSVETSLIRDTPVRICQVDDNPDVIEMAELVLSCRSDGRRPLLFLGFNDPREVVERIPRLLTEERPNVFVVDYTMPGMNGLQLSREIREHPESEQTAVLLYTAQDRIALPPDEKLLEAGVDAVLDKMLLGGSPNRFMMITRIAAARRRKMFGTISS